MHEKSERGMKNVLEQEITTIRKHKVREALRGMKSGKTLHPIGSDDIPVETHKCLGETVVFLLVCSTRFKRV